jgi:hypothetical protein
MSTITRRVRFLDLTQELMGPVGHILVAGAVTGRIPAAGAVQAGAMLERRHDPHGEIH